MIDHLSLALADSSGLCWAQQQVVAYHYLHRPVDVRSCPLAYIVQFRGKPMGCLIFGRPESTRVTGWYGSVEDVAVKKCPLTRWQILNLARVWLHPDLQAGGRSFVPNAASWAISQALRVVGYDFLIHRPPVWLSEPYEIRQVISYCNTNLHRGALYRAASFHLVRANKHGIETYARTIRHLTHAEHAEIARRSLADMRARRLRAARMVMQASLFGESAEAEQEATS